MKQFKKKHPGAELSFEIAGDIAADNAVDDALKRHPEIKHVLPTASSASFGFNKPLDKVYIKPAVNGTLNILNTVKNTLHK